MKLNDLLGKLTSEITDTVASKAKSSAITTLKDPEFKAVVNQFTKDWIEENKVVLIAIVGSCLLLSTMAIINIFSNFKKS